MQIDRPTWHLKKLCPVCGQGSALALCACPTCGRIVISCDEEGSYFPAPKFTEHASAYPLGQNAAKCPGCGISPISQFLPATGAAIAVIGFTEEDYE